MMGLALEGRYAATASRTCGEGRRAHQREAGPAEKPRELWFGALEARRADTPARHIARFG
jgi:hypothetical protein